MEPEEDDLAEVDEIEFDEFFDEESGGANFMPNNNEQQYQPLTFDAIKIGLASPEKILEWSQRRGYQAGDHQLQNIESRRKTVCSVKRFSDRARTGSVTVVNIKKSATKALSVTAAALR